VLNTFSRVASKVDLETSELPRKLRKVYSPTRVWPHVPAHVMCCIRILTLSPSTASSIHGRTRPMWECESAWGTLVANRASRQPRWQPNAPDAVLAMMVEISAQVPEIQPTSYSYANTLQAWSCVRVETTPTYVFENIVQPTGPSMHRTGRDSTG
jgi:hypothetical protein